MARGRLLLGLDIGSSSVKLVQLSETRKALELQHFATAPLPPESVVDGAYMNTRAIVDTIKGLVAANRIRNREVALSVSGHSVIIKKISLPSMSAEELERSIQWEAEQYIPFDINDVNIDVQILNPHAEGGQMDVLLVAAKKEVVEEQVALVREAGLVPMVMDVDCFAIQNMFEQAYGAAPGEVVVLLNIGAGVVNINVVSGGLTAFTRDIAMGGNNFTDEIQKQLNISYEEAEAYKVGGEEGVDEDSVIPQEVEEIIHGVADQMVGEVQRSLEFFASTSAEGPYSKVFLSGGTARLPAVHRVLERRLGVPVEVMDPFRNVVVDEKRFNLDFIRRAGPTAGVAVGLALRKAGDRWSR